MHTPIARFWALPCEVVPRRWWGFAERLDGAAQIGEGITDRNQPVALTLHGFILPWPCPALRSSDNLPSRDENA